MKHSVIFHVALQLHHVLIPPGAEDIFVVAPVQKFTNRSDQRGGSTIGPVTAGQIPCRIVDMGIAILAMHSARELMAVKDYEYTFRSFVTYYQQ